MAPQHTTDEADIRQRVERYAAAIRARDLDAVRSIFAPDLVSFDLEAPLKHVGAEAKRRNWTRAFAACRDPLGYEIRDLALALGDGVAFGHSLDRIGGTLKNGRTADTWPSGRSTANGSSPTTRSRCRSMSRAAEDCGTSCPDGFAGRKAA